MTIEEVIAQMQILQGDYIDQCGGYPYNEFEERDISAFDEAIELLEKVRDGRMIELPCKVGDMVYMHNRNKTKVQEMVFDSPDIRCHCKKDDEFSCCMPVCGDHQNGICAHRFRNDFSEIGKTVFLTRDEAEKALKEREKK